MCNSIMITKTIKTGPNQLIKKLLLKTNNMFIILTWNNLTFTLTLEIKTLKNQST